MIFKAWLYYNKKFFRAALFVYKRAFFVPPPPDLAVSAKLSSTLLKKEFEVFDLMQPSDFLFTCFLLAFPLIPVAYSLLIFPNEISLLFVSSAPKLSSW